MLVWVYQGCRGPSTTWTPPPPPPPVNILFLTSRSFSYLCQDLFFNLGASFLVTLCSDNFSLLFDLAICPLTPARPVQQMQALLVEARTRGVYGKKSDGDGDRDLREPATLKGAQQLALKDVESACLLLLCSGRRGSRPRSRKTRRSGRGCLLPLLPVFTSAVFASSRPADSILCRKQPAVSGPGGMQVPAVLHVERAMGEGMQAGLTSPLDQTLILQSVKSSVPRP